PGPALPNRSFLHSATSQLGEGETIYERLHKWGVSAKVYYHDWTAAFSYANLRNHPRKFFGLFEDFERACREDQLPGYSLIEPRYFDCEQDSRVLPASDQHPNHGVSAGDRLIRDVYMALRSNQQVWESTLLAITYDQHGGL